MHASIHANKPARLFLVLGALFLYFTSQWMTYAGISPYFQEAVTGAVIIVVIGMDCTLHRRRKLLEELA